MPSREVLFDLPIVDHHAHLRPGPSALQAASAFARQGGTHLFLATQNYLPRTPRSLEEYRTQFDTTEELARAVEQGSGLRVFVVLAPYPIDLVHGHEALGLVGAEELQHAAIDLALDRVREGRAVALGEVGRAHFPIDEPVKEALERVLDHALAGARQAGCPAVLHTGDLDASGYAELSQRVRQSGLSAEKALKHYARTYVPPEGRSGLTPSFLAKRDVVRSALGEGGPFFFETDFLDDPTRPGVALPLETVARRARSLLTSCEPSRFEELIRALSIPFEEAPRKVYGLELSRATPLRLTVPA